MSTFSPPLLPDPVDPPNTACRRRNSTRHGSASSNGPSSAGSVIERDRRTRPRDRVRVRVAVEYPQLEPVGQVIGGRVDAHRAPEGAKPRLDRGNLRR